jgi:hypothetical protein
MQGARRPGLLRPHPGTATQARVGRTGGPFDPDSASLHTRRACRKLDRNDPLNGTAGAYFSTRCALVMRGGLVEGHGEASVNPRPGG